MKDYKTYVQICNKAQDINFIKENPLTAADWRLVEQCAIKSIDDQLHTLSDNQEADTFLSEILISIFKPEIRHLLNMVLNGKYFITQTEEDKARGALEEKKALDSFFEKIRGLNKGTAKGFIIDTLDEHLADRDGVFLNMLVNDSFTDNELKTAIGDSIVHELLNKVDDERTQSNDVYEWREGEYLWMPFLNDKDAFNYTMGFIASLKRFLNDLSILCLKHNLSIGEFINWILYNNDIDKFFAYKLGDGSVKGPGTTRVPDAHFLKKDDSTPILEMGGTGYSSFERLFSPKYQPHVDKFIEVLREVDKPLINDHLEWIGDVSAAILYFDALKEKGILDHTVKATPTAKLFAGKFKGLNASSFTKRPQAGSRITDYKQIFLDEIDSVLADIKLLI